MQLPNWFKIGWWVILSVSLGVILSGRLEAIRSGSASSVDAFLFLLLIILLLLPLFQEFNLFGVKLKSEITELKSEVKDQITNLRNEILTIGVNTQVSPHIYLSPPPDNQLPQIEEKFRTILAETLKSHKVDTPVDIQTELLMPHDVNYLFTVRYTIEKQLRRIWKERFQGEEERRPTPIFKMVQVLKESELLEPQLANVIREVYAVCSPAIHGEEVSERKAAFVRDIAPNLIAALMAIT